MSTPSPNFPRQFSPLQFLRVLAIWIGCVLTVEAFLFGVAFGLAGEGRRVTLSKDWRATTGTVVTVDRSNHNSVTIRYNVDGQQVERTFTGSEKNVGEVLDVYYSPSDLNLADITNPSVSVRHDLRLLFLAGLVLGTFISVIISFRAISHALAWPWTKFRLKPRFVMTWVAIATFIGAASNLLSAPIGTRVWLADAFAVCGATLLCVEAFRLASEIQWPVFVRSRLFIFGLLFVIIGQLIVWTG